MATGRASAIVLAREGASVVLADIRADRADETRAMIEDEGGRAVTFVGDMSKTADCAAMVSAAVDTFGTLDVLVNNLAVAQRGDVVGTSEDDWDRVFNTSLRTQHERVGELDRIVDVGIARGPQLVWRSFHCPRSPSERLSARSTSERTAALRRGGWCRR